jgi:hypothetical protein
MSDVPERAIPLSALCVNQLARSFASRRGFVTPFEVDLFSSLPRACCNDVEASLASGNAKEISTQPIIPGGILEIFMLPLASVSCESNSTTRVPSLRVSLTVTPGSGLLAWLILTEKFERNSVSLGLHPYIEQAADEVGRDANTSAQMARKCDFMAGSRSRKSILRGPLKF